MAVYVEKEIGQLENTCHDCGFMRTKRTCVVCSHNPPPDGVDGSRLVHLNGTCEYWEVVIPF